MAAHSNEQKLWTGANKKSETEKRMLRTLEKLQNKKSYVHGTRSYKQVVIHNVVSAENTITNNQILR